MTSVSDVHLFAWMKENATILGTFLLVLWAMMTFWFRTIINRFPTKNEMDNQIALKINECRLGVDEQQKNIINAIKDVSSNLKDMDDRLREDTKEHTEKHEQIIKDMSNLKR